MTLAIAAASYPDLSLECFADVSVKGYLMTVSGEIKPSDIGYTLSHEHILVDFIGADLYNPTRWNHEDVIRVVVPYLLEIMKLGCRTLVECTPAYIGRDPLLLRKISDQIELNILTNTGYYGAADNKYLTSKVYSLDTRELADIWIKEYEYGIADTGIKPGFIKIGVAPGPLSELHKKIVIAAGFTHLETGLSIASHTGPALPAFEQIYLLKSIGIKPEAFIWVHAQNEPELSERLKAARIGAWVSLDSVNENNVIQYVEWLQEFKQKGLLNKVLVSQDAGWYSPGEPNGGDFTPYSTVFNKLIPELRNKRFTRKDIEQVFVKNPGKAFETRIRKT